MFIIVQDIINEAHEDVESFDCFDLLTTPTGIPIKFNTEVEAVKFLSSLGITELYPDSFQAEEGEIRIDRVH
jgi:nickel-dependent lactate racemase|tara:strand:- start:179 stop:394 length:216 start_codon:yes stop_codon:yes gene_type:complete